MQSRFQSAEVSCFAGSKESGWKRLASAHCICAARSWCKRATAFGWTVTFLQSYLRQICPPDDLKTSERTESGPDSFDGRLGKSLAPESWNSGYACPAGRGEWQETPYLLRKYQGFGKACREARRTKRRMTQARRACEKARAKMDSKLLWSYGMIWRSEKRLLLRGRISPASALCQERENKLGGYLWSRKGSTAANSSQEPATRRSGFAPSTSLANCDNVGEPLCRGLRLNRRLGESE